MKKVLFAILLFTGLTGLFLNKALGADDLGPKLEFKGQKKSVTTWGNLPTESFLSFKEWKDESDIRDQVPNWERIIRERDNRELVGRVFQCVGVCRIDRGESFFNGSHRTGIYEGDEFQTFGESYAWVFLLDGTMIRLSPGSSITFNEFNIGVKENFINARVNAGNIVWLSRHELPFEELNTRETDVLFFPLDLFEASPIIEKKDYKEVDLYSLIEEPKDKFNQYIRLNDEIGKNNKMTMGKKTYAFVVLPNATIMGQSPNMELVVLLGGKSFLKKRSFAELGLKNYEEKEIDELFMQMRGFENKELTSIKEAQWISIDEKGRSFATIEDINWLSIGEFITKRIPSIMLGREIFISRYSELVFREKYDPYVLAKNDGYRLWGKIKSDNPEKKDDLELRLEFLKEYFRRIETSNLLASSRFKKRLEERGEKVESSEYGTHYFVKALKHYYYFNDYTDERETGEVLNSTTKDLWKRMHGIR